MKNKIEVRLANNPENGPIRRRVFLEVLHTNLNPETLNGFVAYHDTEKTKESARLIYNSPDKTLYIMSMDVIGKATEDNCITFAQSVINVTWPAAIAELLQHNSSLALATGVVEVVCEPIPLLANYGWLAHMLDSPETQLRYEEFLKNGLIYERLKKFCVQKELKIEDGMHKSVMLPIHIKEPVSGEIMIHKNVKIMFEQYTFSNNFLLGFEVGSIEHDLGKMMRLVPPFNRYMLEKAVYASENPGVVLNSKGDEEEYERQILKATKVINKSPYLIQLFVGNLKMQ